MFKKTAQNGFLLVEILVSLLIVSLTAVNITGLQKLIVEQNRDNVAHTEVIALANQKMNELLSYNNATSLDALVDITETPGLTTFNLEWTVISDSASDPDESVNIRTVTLNIKWDNSKGSEQTYTYSEKINLTPSRANIESVFETNNFSYFNPKKTYNNKDFVIYNSELFQFSAGNSHPRDVNNPETVSDGWTSYGLINNKDLKNNSDLDTLFSPP
ncbi:type IV pilin [Psychromonas ingrahamii 37]|uniref:Type IV pilin n=1 Tax=Psychromonas ingrahamii (strain DSM 17664 / CCUG 51855 / 37) TaxID=357804 RepID=A1SZA0_PSYIN|nr:type II secretion system protein [Psychromonas ingrahamii]ABM04815.1 type IV pilin [Psychromonas ingrahamii 37]